MSVQIDIFGGVVCRDMIRLSGQDEFAINRCIGGVPVSTLYERPAPLNEAELEKAPVSQYDKRMLKIQAKRSAVKILQNSEAKVLLIDLADECMTRYRYGKNIRQSAAYPEEMEQYIEKIFTGGEGGGSGRRYLPTDADMDMVLLEKKYKKFFRDIVRSEENPGGYPEKNIVIIEALFAEDYVANNDGAAHSFDARYKVKEKNEWLKKLYEIVYKCIPECQVIKLPMFTHASENHLRGPGPLSYTEETYQYLSETFGVLCGIYKRNSTENLYKERGLQNKLYTRLLRAGGVNSIPQMKKQINDLEQQVAELKKEIAALKKK